MNAAKDFVLHLRIPYNILILSAPFFLGVVYLQTDVEFNRMLFLFLVLYVLLFGGVNAYNSYFDKDEGPIGGLERPPKMERWMYYAAVGLQIVGLVLSLHAGILYVLLFIMAIILSWAYSGPHVRLKGKPLPSFIVIGFGTAGPVLLGYLAAGGREITPALIVGAVGASLLIVSMYPFSQIYQMDEDRRRGDTTFAVKYGITGVHRNFLILFPLGILLITISFLFQAVLAISAFIAGMLSFFLMWSKIKRISSQKKEYRNVMRAKYFGGTLFTVIVVVLALIF